MLSIDFLDLELETIFSLIGARVLVGVWFSFVWIFFFLCFGLNFVVRF